MSVNVSFSVNVIVSVSVNVIVRVRVVLQQAGLHAEHRNLGNTVIFTIFTQAAITFRQGGCQPHAQALSAWRRAAGTL